MTWKSKRSSRSTQRDRLRMLSHWSATYLLYDYFNHTRELPPPRRVKWGRCCCTFQLTTVTRARWRQISLRVHSECSHQNAVSQLCSRFFRVHSIRVPDSSVGREMREVHAVQTTIRLTTVATLFTSPFLQLCCDQNGDKPLRDYWVKCLVDSHLVPGVLRVLLLGCMFQAPWLLRSRVICAEWNASVFRKFRSTRMFSLKVN